MHTQRPGQKLEYVLGYYVSQEDKEKTFKNLRLLRDYLVENFDYVDKHFNMRNWRLQKAASKGFTEVNYKSKYDCGTHGCLMGWVPFALEHKIDDRWFGDFEELDFAKLSMGVFPALCPEVRCGIYELTDAWIFLFTGKWAEVDNTLEGAIARIDVVLAGDFLL